MDWENVREYAYALRPQLCDGEQIGTGKASLLWLNPQDQANCRMGWFTAGEILAWRNGQDNPVELSGEEKEQRAKSHRAMDDQERTLEDAMGSLRQEMAVTSSSRP